MLFGRLMFTSNTSSGKCVDFKIKLTTFKDSSCNRGTESFLFSAKCQNLISLMFCQIMPEKASEKLNWSQKKIRAPAGSGRQLGLTVIRCGGPSCPYCRCRRRFGRLIQPNWDRSQGQGCPQFNVLIFCLGISYLERV